jgi:hypothetical protein
LSDLSSTVSKKLHHHSTCRDISLPVVELNHCGWRQYEKVKEPISQWEPMPIEQFEGLLKQD